MVVRATTVCQLGACAVVMTAAALRASSRASRKGDEPDLWIIPGGA